MSEEPDFGDEYDPEQVAEHETTVDRLTREAADATRNFVERRQLAYKRIFGAAHSEDVQIVMDDLRRFCAAYGTPWDANERIHCLLSGRHEVYSRIDENLTWPLDDLVIKYTTKTKVEE